MNKFTVTQEVDDKYIWIFDKPKSRLAGFKIVELLEISAGLKIANKEGLGRDVKTNRVLSKEFEVEINQR